jgi:hypothetical protein
VIYRLQLIAIIVITFDSRYRDVIYRKDKMKYKFSDLEFNTHPIGDGIQALVSFPNSFGASIVKASFSYGGDEGLYELAVLKNDCICYDTPITKNVVGNCTENDIENLLEQISIRTNNELR